MRSPVPALLSAVCRVLRLTPDRGGLLRTLLLMAAVYALVAALHPGREQRVFRHALTIGMTAALLVAYGCGHRQLRSFAPPRRLLFGGFALLAAVALFVPAFQSSDVRAYGQIGWLQAGHDANPYVVVPADLPDAVDDPMFTRTWRDAPCIYGFLFAHVAHAVAWLGGGDPARTSALFKAFGALLLGMLGAGLWRILAAADEGLADRTLYLFLWSPFLVLQFVSNAHNDLLFSLFLLAALQGARAGRWWAVLPALTLAVFVKLVAAILVPAALILLVRRKGPAFTAASATVCLFVGWAISLPYSLELASFDWQGIRAQLAQPSYSIVAMLADLWASLARAVPLLEGSEGRVAFALQALFALGFAGFFALRTRAAWRDAGYDGEGFLRDAVALLFALIVVASAKFFPWYLGMLLPAALLLPERHPLRRLTLLLTLTWMLVFTFVGKARILDALLMTVLPVLLFWRRNLGYNADACNNTSTTSRP